MFLANPGIYVADLIHNGGFTNYNALQLELRRPLRNGVMGQVNYTLAQQPRRIPPGTSRSASSRSSTTPGRSSTKGGSQFHVTHVMNANLIAELPFGEGRRWLNRGGLSDGWPAAGRQARSSTGRADRRFQSWRGAVPSIARSRSANQTAHTTLSASEIKKLLGVREANGNIYWIDPAVIDPNTGRAAGRTRWRMRRASPGRCSSIRWPGKWGSWRSSRFEVRRNLSSTVASPSACDSGASRPSDPRRRVQSFQHRQLLGGDDDINSTTFGQITDTNTAPRVVQLVVKLDF